MDQQDQPNLDENAALKLQIQLLEIKLRNAEADVNRYRSVAFQAIDELVMFARDMKV